MSSYIYIYIRITLCQLQKMKKVTTTLFCKGYIILKILELDFYIHLVDTLSLSFIISMLRYLKLVNLLNIDTSTDFLYTMLSLSAWNILFIHSYHASRSYPRCNRHLEIIASHQDRNR